MTEFQMPLNIETRLRHLDVLDRITQISIANDNMQDVLGRVLDLVLQVFNADRAWFLYPCDPDAPSWSVPMERTRPEWPGLFAQGVDMPMDSNMSGVYRELLRADGAIQNGPGTDQPVPPLVAQMFLVKSQLMITLHPKIGKSWVFGLHHCASAVMHDEEDIESFYDCRPTYFGLPQRPDLSRATSRERRTLEIRTGRRRRRRLGLEPQNR